MKKLRPRSYWLRHKRQKCECLGYWFPHRRGGGACDHSRTAVYHQALRRGLSRDEAMFEQATETPGYISKECPF